MYIERAHYRPYPVPELDLPAQSGWRTCLDGFTDGDSPVSSVVQSAIGRVAREQSRALDHLENAVVSPASFAASLTSFAEAASTVAHVAFAHATSTPAAAPTPAQPLVEHGDRLAANQAIYDQFFRVTRNREQNEVGFAASILSAFSRVLFDFPYSSIARSEILVILRAMVRSLEIIGGKDGAANVFPLVPTDSQPSLASELQVAWDASDLDPDWMTHVADHRWIAGHHLFFTFANFCRISRDRAADSVRSGDNESVADHLYDAAIFQRALPAAMWYAGDFPPSLYRSHTRAWMSGAGSANGFSGTDNVDYSDLHSSRTEMTKTLFAAFGHNAEEWPTEVERALRTLHEAETQHAEHHVLIAARMVGTDASLVQKRMTRAVFNAVDVLRDMVAEEWTDLSNRFE